MKKQTKIIIAIIAAIVVAFGGYYSYKSYSLNKRVKASEEIVKVKGIKLEDKDKIIVDEMLKNDTDLEYAYISHNGETIMLNLKFKKGIQDKDKYSKVGKYMEKVREEYTGKNVNATMIPNK